MRIYQIGVVSAGLLSSAVSMLPSPSLAVDCNINAKSITGTYGIATSGDAFEGNALNLPVGRFSQAGTLTQSEVIDTDLTLTGIWKALVQQNGQTGAPVTLTFGGNFVVSKETCTGQFFLDDSTPTFFTVFVDDGNEQRTTSLIPDFPHFIL